MNWNSLPESLVNSSNVLIFKTLLDERWQSYRFILYDLSTFSFYKTVSPRTDNKKTLISNTCVYMK